MAEAIQKLKVRGGHFIGGPVEEAEAYLAERAAELGRKCGNCSMCCKLLDIDDPELVKPEGQWCPHCKPKHGCTIYERRPLVCRVFSCQWLVDPSFGPEWFPVRSKMVVRMLPDAVGALSLNVYVDSAYPTAWRRSPYYEHLVDRSTRISVTIIVADRQIGLRYGREYELGRHEGAIVYHDGTVRTFPAARAARFEHGESG